MKYRLSNTDFKVQAWIDTCISRNAKGISEYLQKNQAISKLLVLENRELSMA